jgi:hypothetical protein
MSDYITCYKNRTLNVTHCNHGYFNPRTEKCQDNVPKGIYSHLKFYITRQFALPSNKPYLSFSQQQKTHIIQWLQQYECMTKLSNNQITLHLNKHRQFKENSDENSYIVGYKINPIRYCKILNVSRNLQMLG